MDTHLKYKNILKLISVFFYLILQMEKKERQKENYKRWLNKQNREEFLKKKSENAKIYYEKNKENIEIKRQIQIKINELEILKKMLNDI